jgi:hypothetical protein
VVPLLLLLLVVVVVLLPKARLLSDWRSWWAPRPACCVLEAGRAALLRTREGEAGLVKEPPRAAGERRAVGVDALR